MKVRVALAGLGSRGKNTYAPVAKMIPDKMEITAIADIDPEKVQITAEEYGIPNDRCFSSAEEMLDQENLADVMFITTMDRQHVRQAVKAIQKGYHLLLEKPISPDQEECRELLRTAKEYQKKVVICHVLRYTPFYGEVKKLMDRRVIGDVVSVMAIENVGYWHQAHSFVRGNWRNSDTSSPMILQKCCHDFDLLLWLTGKTCQSVSSFGDTYLFQKEMAPVGAAARCMDGCLAKESCPYDAEKIYLYLDETGVCCGHTEWPADVLAEYPTEEKIREALKTGPYGRCVYACDNNVVDHQVVNMSMTDGSTMHLTMCAFTEHKESRYTKFMGTKGCIIADLGKNVITVKPFGEKEYVIDVSKLADDFSGHAGGDSRMVEEFIDLIRQNREPGENITSLEQSMESHFCAFAAEESRCHGGQVVMLDQIRNRK